MGAKPETRHWRRTSNKGLEKNKKNESGGQSLAILQVQPKEVLRTMTGMQFLIVPLLPEQGWQEA